MFKRPTKSAPVLLAAAVTLAFACTQPAAEPAADLFRHDVSAAPKPWSHDRFDDADGGFTFAIFTDLNGGERDRIFEVAVAQLNLLRPELIMSIGDLIDGGSEDRERLAAEWDSFDRRADAAIAPVFYVGGNHDLTNLTMREVWEGRYGTRYYHFVYKNVLFLILDTEDHAPARMAEIYEARATYIDLMEAGTSSDELRETEYFQMPERITGEIGAIQSEYFLQVLTENPDVRWTMLFMHKPVWQREDDLDFAAVETALGDRPYTLFNGHLHTYSHTERNGRDYIMLGTTGGSQNPASDMAFDHVSLVTMTADGPVIGHLKMEGILDKTGHVPLGGDTLCFQASKC